jgi:hypothetical protein
MAALAERALAYAQAPPVELPGPLSGVKAWDRVDATTGRVRDALMEDVRGTGASAALKGPTGRSGGCGAPGRSHGSPAREHARPHRPLDASGRGDGRRADLASARLARLRACETSEVRFVRRRQDHGQPQVDSLARGQGTRACVPGTDLEARLAADTLVRDGRVIDAEVQGGGGTHPRPLRLGGVQTSTGDGGCLTHLPPRVGPRPVAALSRVRWEVELSRKLATAVHRLDASDAARPCSLKTLLQASLIASMLAALLAHTHHLQTRPTPVGAPRTVAPLHTRLLALQLAVSCQSIAQAFDRQGAAATQRWNTIAAWLTHAGRDPNGRRRPSVFDQVRGWKRQPVAREKNRQNRPQMAA